MGILLLLATSYFLPNMTQDTSSARHLLCSGSKRPQQSSNTSSLTRFKVLEAIRIFHKLSSYFRGFISQDKVNGFLEPPSQCVSLLFSGTIFNFLGHFGNKKEFLLGHYTRQSALQLLQFHLLLRIAKTNRPSCHLGQDHHQHCRQVKHVQGPASCSCARFNLGHKRKQM